MPYSPPRRRSPEGRPEGRPGGTHPEGRTAVRKEAALNFLTARAPTFFAALAERAGDTALNCLTARAPLTGDAALNCLYIGSTISSRACPSTMRKARIGRGASARDETMK